MRKSQLTHRKRAAPPTDSPLDAILRQAAEKAEEPARAWLLAMLERGEMAEGTVGEAKPAPDPSDN